MSSDPRGAEAWYRNGWVWLLVLLPASVVVASFATLFVALSHPQSLVRDDYYRDGLAINRQLAQADVARALALDATLRYDAASGILQLRFARGLPQGEQLSLAIIHPTDAAHDRAVLLQRTAPDRYETRLDGPLAGRWHLQLAEPGALQQWQLQGSLDAQDTGSARLLPVDR